MAWFNNVYVCPDCQAYWEDEWSAMSDDSCPNCELSDISPASSNDLSVIVERNCSGSLDIYVSHDSATELPKYIRLQTIPKKKITTLAGSLAFEAE